MRFEVDDNNCYVQCVYNCGKPRLLSMLFDTGAVCTTIRIDNIQGAHCDANRAYKQIQDCQ